MSRIITYREIKSAIDERFHVILSDQLSDYLSNHPNTYGETIESRCFDWLLSSDHILDKDLSDERETLIATIWLLERGEISSSSMETQFRYIPIAHSRQQAIGQGMRKFKSRAPTMWLNVKTLLPRPSTTDCFKGVLIALIVTAVTNGPAICHSFGNGDAECFKYLTQVAPVNIPPDPQSWIPVYRHIFEYVFKSQRSIFGYPDPEEEVNPLFHGLVFEEIDSDKRVALITDPTCLIQCAMLYLCIYSKNIRRMEFMHKIMPLLFIYGVTFGLYSHVELGAMVMLVICASYWDRHISNMIENRPILTQILLSLLFSLTCTYYTDSRTSETMIMEDQIDTCPFESMPIIRIGEILSGHRNEIEDIIVLDEKDPNNALYVEIESILKVYFSTLKHPLDQASDRESFITHTEKAFPECGHKCILIWLLQYPIYLHDRDSSIFKHMSLTCGFDGAKAILYLSIFERADAFYGIHEHFPLTVTNMRYISPILFNQSYEQFVTRDDVRDVFGVFERKYNT